MNQKLWSEMLKTHGSILATVWLCRGLPRYQLGHLLRHRQYNRLYVLIHNTKDLAIDVQWSIMMTYKYIVHYLPRLLAWLVDSRSGNELAKKLISPGTIALHALYHYISVRSYLCLYIKKSVVFFYCTCTVHMIEPITLPYNNNM